MQAGIRGLFSFFVGADGVGPSTSFLSGKRSTAELRTLFRSLVFGRWSLAKDQRLATKD